ncbi:TetR family transcriptional regulator [Nesterenkonia sp.]|uniref:TetR/AcrR family transcriptional regulator n=1 Tax=Nesterenkonia sp. TaxID=704201 RepID=UPI002607EAFF|nr:TetR family transcriptional regulator [Nesterenkonia sp.]
MVYTYGATRSRRGHESQETPAPRTAAESGNSSAPAPERILQAAIHLYGEHGFDRVTIKEIARHAGVSAPLVIHHFGSKAGLRKACDEHAAEQFREAKTEGVHHQGPMPRNYVYEALRTNRPLIKYLVRAFAVGGPEMDQLFDRLIEDSLEYTAEAEELGLVYPSANPRNRAAVLLLQQFGSLMLHRQMKRQLDFDPLEDEPEAAGPYWETVIELYTRPVINPDIFGELLQAQQETTDGSTATPTDVDSVHNPDTTKGTER